MLYPDEYPTTIPDLDLHLKAGIPHDALQRYYDKVIAHVGAVQDAGQKLGVEPALLAEHDLSKFSAVEFSGYTLHFECGGAPWAFAPAWLHHIHCNPHHWQHWMFADGFSPSDSGAQHGVLPMPEAYALEMVADWMGASKIYSGTEDMSEWLSANMRRIHLHTSTATYIRSVLKDLGYGKIVDEGQFAHELKFSR